MKHIRSVVALALLAVFLAGIARATTSTVNPAVPCQNCPLSSSTIRNGISLPAYNDITNLWSAVATGSGISTISGDISCTGSPAASCALANTSTARADLGLPLGTSGATVGLLNGNLTFSGTDKFSLNATALPATQTGTVLQLGNADGAITRLEVDAFGNTPHFSAIRWDGTNASPTAIQSGDGLGSLNFWGYNGTGVVGPQAAVRCFASQNWSVGSNGTYCDLDVTPNGSTTLTAAMTIGNDGGITLGSPTGGDKGAGTLNATGLYVNGAAVSGAGGSGTVSSGTTGQVAWYSSSGTTVSGNSALTLTATGLGVGATPTDTLDVNGSLGFTTTNSTGPTNGMYLSAANTPAINAASTRQFAISSVGGTTIGSTSEGSYLTINTNLNGGFTVNSSNTSGPGISLAGGGHTYNFFATGSGSAQNNWFGVYDATAVGTAMGIYGGTGTNTGMIVQLGSTTVLGWGSSAAAASAANDTGLSRDAAGIVDVGTGVAANTTGKIKAAAYFLAGTKFTVSGCSATATSGGATGGLITLGANNCTVVVTMGNSVTATTGFACDAHDRTAPTVLIGGESSSTTTTASITIPAGAGANDAISFACLPY